MKILLLPVLFFVSFFARSQAVFVSADPAIGEVLVSSSDPLLTPNTLPLDGIIQLRIPIFNLNTINSIPVGSCKININLGSKFIIDPLFDFSTLPSSNYITWIAASGGREVRGELNTDLPADFKDTVVLDVKAIVEGQSFFITNFLVTNHNTQILLSDENGANNGFVLPYFVIPGGPLPVSFTGFTAVNKACGIKVDFYTESEINVNKYEIETSKDGTNFVKNGEVVAASLPHYQYDFSITASNKANLMYIRIKSIDKDGSFKYSETNTVKGLCDDEWAVGIFPNPAKAVSNITIRAKQGSFNGKYAITLSDIAGKLMLVKNVNLLNAGQFNLETGNLSAGQYIIQINSEDRGQSSSIKWQKY